MSAYDQAQKVFWELQKQYFSALHQAEIAHLILREYEEGFREGNLIPVINDVVNAQINLSLSYAKLESHIIEHIDREFCLFNPEEINDSINKKKKS